MNYFYNFYKKHAVNQNKYSKLFHKEYKNQIPQSHELVNKQFHKISRPSFLSAYFELVVLIYLIINYYID